MDGVTVVEQDSVPTGALVYARGTGYGPEARLTVHDLLAVTAGAARALVGLVSGPDDPAALDLVASGPQAQLLDYF